MKPAPNLGSEGKLSLDGRDIEFAFSAGQLYLLQCRAVTKAAGGSAAPAAPAPAVATLTRAYLDDADPPVLLGYNTDDPLVRYAHGQQLWNALRARPARAGRDVFPPGLTGGHGGVWLPEQTLRTFLARTIG